MDVLAWNRDAWDREVARGSPWTVPADESAIAAARRGEVRIRLTPTKPIPQEWFPPLAGCRVLGLAASGGQQAPTLAAAGAEVTVLDMSPAQLAQDRRVAEREGLVLRLEEGDMADLSRFEDASFDLIVHPCSNTFVPEVRPVWSECFRVLRPGCDLLAGFVNPLLWIFDDSASKRADLQVRYRIPYSDLESLSDAERQHYIDDGLPLCFGHTLDDLIGGQLAVGFSLIGFYEDVFDEHPLDAYIASMIATRARKP